LQDFTRADARSRALRTLFIGIGMSALWGVVNVLGALSGVNWFDEHALTSVATMLATSVFGSVGSYVARIAKEPAPIAPLTVGLPAKSR